MGDSGSAPPRKLMPADAAPGVEVATIKPNDSGIAGMQVLTFRGRSLITENSSLADLMMFAYSVQMKQIIGAPDWIEKDRYDVNATPDVEGNTYRRSGASHDPQTPRGPFSVEVPS